MFALNQRIRPSLEDFPKEGSGGRGRENRCRAQSEEKLAMRDKVSLSGAPNRRSKGAVEGGIPCPPGRPYFLGFLFSPHKAQNHTFLPSSQYSLRRLWMRNGQPPETPSVGHVTQRGSPYATGSRNGGPLAPRAVTTVFSSGRWIRRLATLALSQLTALAVAMTGVCVTSLVNTGADVPASFQSTVAYASLILVYAPIWLWSRWNARRRKDLPGPEPTSFATAAPRRESPWRESLGASSLSSSLPSLAPHGVTGNRSDYRGVVNAAALSPATTWREEAKGVVGSDASTTSIAAAAPLWFNFAPWKYAIIALFDLEANFAAVSAYRFTDMTSVQLLDCLTVPFVMLLAWAVFRRRPTPFNFVGALVAVVGLTVLFVDDILGGSMSLEASPHPAWGDGLCVAAAACYAVSNVACEYLLKTNPVVAGEDTTAGPSPPHGSPTQYGVSETNNHSDRPEVPTTTVEEVASSSLCTQLRSLIDTRELSRLLEYLAVMPAFAFVFSLLQVTALGKWDAVANVSWWHAVVNVAANTSTAATTTAAMMPSTTTGSPGSFTTAAVAPIVPMIGFGAMMVLLYSGMPLLFLLSSAAFANVGLLAADVYSVALSALVFHVTPLWPFYLSFCLIASGVLLYDANPSQFQRCTLLCRYQRLSTG